MAAEGASPPPPASLECLCVYNVRCRVVLGVLGFGCEVCKRAEIAFRRVMHICICSLPALQTRGALMCLRCVAERTVRDAMWRTGYAARALPRSPDP